MRSNSFGMSFTKAVATLVDNIHHSCGKQSMQTAIFRIICRQFCKTSFKLCRHFLSSKRP